MSNYTDAQIRAQKAAARVLGKADTLLISTRLVLAVREKELLDLKGPCSGAQGQPCRLHYAHSGPCDPRKPEEV